MGSDNEQVRKFALEMLGQLAPGLKYLIEQGNAVNSDEAIEKHRDDYVKLVMAATEYNDLCPTKTGLSGFTLFSLFLGAYQMGYCKGRATTPLTLVVAGDDGEEV